MRRVLGWLLLLLLPAFACAEAGLPRIVAEKQTVQDAQPGMYTYDLTVTNQGPNPVERVFVDESGAASGMILTAGAFCEFSGGDVLLNQNGTATILCLEPNQTVTLRYTCALPQGFEADTLQTQCNLSAMYTGENNRAYLLMALADQPVALAVSPSSAAEAMPAPTQQDAGDGILDIELERESYDGAIPGQTYENTVTLRNLGTGPLTGITLRLDDLRVSQDGAAPGAWLDTSGWSTGPGGVLEQLAGETLLPDERVVFRCCWTVPTDAADKAEGSVSAWVHNGTGPRQDVCAVFRLNMPAKPWSLQLTKGITLYTDDCIWIAATLSLSAAMIALFRPGRFRPGKRGMRVKTSGADMISAA